MDNYISHFFNTKYKNTGTLLMLVVPTVNSLIRSEILFLFPSNLAFLPPTASAEMNKRFSLVFFTSVDRINVP